MIENIGWTGKSTKTTMQKKIWKMILIVTIPLMLIIILVVGIGIGYGLQYNSILNNVTTASDFNRDFTDNIKTKMYYYVIDSQYSEGMPLEEVKSAEAIASKLIETTSEKDSLRAINSVLNLCHNLEDKMQEIAVTQGYDSRMSQLTIKQFFFRHTLAESLGRAPLCLRFLSRMAGKSLVFSERSFHPWRLFFLLRFGTWRTGIHYFF